MNTTPTLDQLLKRIANVRLFMMFMRPTPLHDLESEEGKQLLREHLQWQFDLEDRGILLGAGPIDHGHEPAPLHNPLISAFGLSILVAATREEAERIAATEPFSLRGWRETQVVSWHLNEGVACGLGREMLDAAMRS